MSNRELAFKAMLDMYLLHFREKLSRRCINMYFTFKKKKAQKSVWVRVKGYGVTCALGLPSEEASQKHRNKHREHQKL